MSGLYAGFLITLSLTALFLFYGGDTLTGWIAVVLALYGSWASYNVWKLKQRVTALEQQREDS